MQAKCLDTPWNPMPQRISSEVVMDILHARSRLGGMEGAEAWPNDPSILAARDRLSRILRFYCCWPNELFLPRDSFNAVSINWNQDNFDAADVVMEIEDMFDIEYPEDDTRFRNLTYLEFIERSLEKFPDCIEKYDAKAMQPFALPCGYHSRGWWNSIKRLILNRHNAWWFRVQQAARGGSWRNLWPDNPDIISARDKTSAILVEEFGWFDDAFVPNDSVDALFLPGKEKRDNVLRAIQRLNQVFPEARLTVEEVKRGDETFVALIQKMLDCATHHGTHSSL